MSMDIVFGILAVVLLLWIWDWENDNDDNIRLGCHGKVSKHLSSEECGHAESV
jgi:hypothetical protein